MASKDIAYGVNITASDAQDAIKEAYKDRAGVNTWTRMLNQAGASYAEQQGALTEDYSKAIGEAYKSSLKNQESIDRLGLATGSHNELTDENRKTLLDAYDAYLSKYAEGTATALENYGNNLNSIEQALGDEAGKVSSLLNKVYDYYNNELSGAYKPGATEEEKEYLKDTFGYYGLDWLIDDAGNVRNREDLMTMLYDEKGNLTEDGREFYYRLMNNMDVKGYRNIDDKLEERDVRSFGEWLLDTDQELFDWYNSADPYNYNEAGTRAGTIKRLLGENPNKSGMAISDTEYAMRNSSVKLDAFLEQGIQNITMGIQGIKNRITEENKLDQDHPMRLAGKVAEGIGKEVGSVIQNLPDINTLEEKYKLTYGKDAPTELRQIYNELTSDKYNGDMTEWTAKKEVIPKLNQLKELMLGNSVTPIDTSKDLSKYTTTNRTVENTSAGIKYIQNATTDEDRQYYIDATFNSIPNLSLYVEGAKKEAGKDNNDKARRRDLVITYGKSGKITADVGSGGARKREELSKYNKPLQNEFNTKYGNSLLAIDEKTGIVYMQFIKGDWVSIYPKYHGDSNDKGGSKASKESQAKEQENMLKAIAYKMMSDNNQGNLIPAGGGKKIATTTYVSDNSLLHK